jgi:predicted peptidase
MKKIISLLLATVMIFVVTLSVSAAPLSDGLDAIRAEFQKGVGPETDGYAIDYRYFSPAEENDDTKYPLLIFLHGMGDGRNEDTPLNSHLVANFASDEFQARFGEGAFIMLPRSLEEKGLFWPYQLIAPLKAAIDDFIAVNGANIDLSRIYIGGYSVGGKMTLVMTIAFPEMFAAALPICPAWSPTSDMIEYIADMPIWLTSATTDPLVTYYFGVANTWNRLAKVTNVPEKCRFTTLTRCCYPDGKIAMSAHHSWIAVQSDMFSSDNGDYPHSRIVDGLGNEVKLEYPNGVISWLMQHTSDYDGTATTGTGNITKDTNISSIISYENFLDFFTVLFNGIKLMFSFL